MADALLQMIEQEVNFQRSVLEALESGKLHWGEKGSDGEWQDHTQSRILTIRRTIAVFEQVLKRHDS